MIQGGVVRLFDFLAFFTFLLGSPGMWVWSTWLMTWYTLVPGPWSLVPTFAWSWHGHTAHHSHTSLYLLQSNLLVLVASAHDGHADYDWIQWSNKIPSFHWLKAQWCLAKECWSVLTVVWDGYPNIFVYINSTKQAHIPAYLCVMCCCVGPGFVGVSPLDELLRGDLWDHQGPPTSYTSSSLTSHIKLYCQPQLVPTFYAS